MVTNKDLLEEIKRQNLRIERIEEELGISSVDDSQEEEEVTPERHVSRSPQTDSIKIKVSFNQVITFLGILGIIIGAISFFFYAVANQWIGRTGQIMIGVGVGFLLFGFATLLRRQKEQWSNILIGGSYFIEYLSIGVGVLEYRVLPDFVGVGLTILFLASSVVLSLLYKSQLISYFSLAGGYLIPFITGTFGNDLFVMLLYLCLSLGLVAVSFVQHWPGLRFTSYGVVALFLLSSSYKFSRATMDEKIIVLFFLLCIFVLYSIASLVSSLKKNSENISILDSLTLVSLSILMLLLVYALFDWQLEFFGIFSMLFSFVSLGEIMFLKSRNKNLHVSVVYSLLANGIVILNMGILFLIHTINEDFFVILFVVEWVLFAVLFMKFKDIALYNVFSKISLALIGIWYYAVVRFDHGWNHATFFMLLYFSVVVFFLMFYKRNIEKNFNGAGFVISGFLYIYSFYKFIWFLGIHNSKLAHIILSILWLIYTLVLFSQVSSSSEKTLVGSLLGLTLLKIAFNDLFYLDGVFRIIGFVIFGILLIIGGYVIKNVQEH